MERHELSSLFGDMTELEFSELKSDIEQNGFAQPVIYVYEGKILDGWHRYQVAVNLEKVSELNFTTLDGIQNPLVFAMGINYFRRHMNESHRAVVKALAHQSEWMQLGDNQHLQGMPHGTPKSSAKMAAEVQVSKRTMDRAKKVVKLGLADEVIKNGKSVSQVLSDPISAEEMADICFVHGNISDAEFEQAKQEAIDNQVPLTQDYLREIALYNHRRNDPQPIPPNFV